MTAVLHLDEEPWRIAAGMAVGVFIGITPFFFLHTLLAVLVAFVFRLNKAATITGAWLNLPWLAPFVYAFCLKLGEAILRGDISLALSGLAEAAAHLRASPRQHAGTLLELLWNLPQNLWDMMFVASKPLFVGTTVVGLVLGVVTYFVTLEAVREVRGLSHSRSLPGEPDGTP